MTTSGCLLCIQTLHPLAINRQINHLDTQRAISSSNVENVYVCLCAGVVILDSDYYNVEMTDLMTCQLLYSVVYKHGD